MEDLTDPECVAAMNIGVNTNADTTTNTTIPNQKTSWVTFTKKGNALEQENEHGKVYTWKLSEKAAKINQSIAELISDSTSDSDKIIELDSNYTAAAVNGLVEFCTYYQDKSLPVVDLDAKFETDDRTDWEKEFTEKISLIDFAIMTRLANHMNNEQLLYLCMKTLVAKMIGKESKEIRRFYALPSDEKTVKTLLPFLNTSVPMQPADI